MRIAWEQIGDVIKANQKIRLAELATKAVFAAHAKSFAPLPQDRAVALASPVFTKVLGSPRTLAGWVRSSSSSRTRFSIARRKRLRLVRRRCARFAPVGDRVNSMARMLDGIGSGGISAAPPRAAAARHARTVRTEVVTGSEPPSTGAVPSGRRLDQMRGR